MGRKIFVFTMFAVSLAMFGLSVHAAASGKHYMRKAGGTQMPTHGSGGGAG